MTKNYCGYFGFVTQDGCTPEEEVELPDKAAVNEFIMKNRNADKLDIAIGTHQIAHSLLAIEKGCILRAPNHNDMFAGIGTPELLAVQEARRQEEQEEYEDDFNHEDNFDESAHPPCYICGNYICDCQM